MRRPNMLAAALALMLAFAGACSGGSGDDGTKRTSTTRPARTVEVLASASLSEPMAELGRRFQAAHRGTKVDFSFSSSNELAERVRYVPADLIATADEETLQPLVAEGLVTGSVVFARNRLAIVVAKGNPKGIASLADLARPGVNVVLCAAQAPCGRLTTEALARAGVKVQPRSFDANVRSVVAKVAFGEVDAGIVFATNARNAADQVDTVEIPPEHNVGRPVTMATLRDAKHAPLAAEFTAFVLSEEGRRAFPAYGLDPP